MDWALYVFGYLKKKPNGWIRIDSRDPVIANNSAEGNFSVDLSAKLKDQYPEVKEVVDKKVPKDLLSKLTITTY
eukprot:2505892-Ditylum_brightwellii.AAC.1